MRDDVWRACPFLRAKNVWASCGQLMRWPRPQAAACLRDPCAPPCAPALATDHGEQDCRALPATRILGSMDDQQRAARPLGVGVAYERPLVSQRRCPPGTGLLNRARMILAGRWWQQASMTSDHHSETTCGTCVLGQRRHPRLRAHRAVRRATAPPGSCATAGLVPVEGADRLASATVPSAAAPRATTITVAERRNGHLTKSVCWLWRKQPLP